MERSADGRGSQGDGNLINRILVICFALLVIPWLSPLPGQEDTTLVQLEQFGGRLAPKALRNNLSIQAEKITFEDALILIAQRGHLRLSYNRSRLPLKQRVSLHLHDVPVLEALLSILDQTGTELVITQNGQLAIVPRKRPGNQ